MSDEQTYSMDEGVDTESSPENLTEEEQDSLKVGEQLEAEQETLLAGKYKTAEELEKAHIELQKKLGEKSSQDSKKVENKNQKEPDQNAQDNILDTLWEQGSANKLDKATFEKIQKMDPIEVAKKAMEMRSKQGQAATQREFTENEVGKIHGLVGGSANYSNMMSWAQQNLNDQEIQLYDKVMELGNPLAAYFAVQSVALKYQDRTGKDGQMVTGKAPKATGDVFNSQAEMVKAMEDDRYNDDPAYREAIMRKLERSNINF